MGERNGKNVGFPEGFHLGCTNECISDRRCSKKKMAKVNTSGMCIQKNLGKYIPATPAKWHATIITDIKKMFS